MFHLPGSGVAVTETDLTVVAGDDSFKNERVHWLRYEALAEMTAMRFEYIGVLYNRNRQHSTRGYKSSVQFFLKLVLSQQKETLVA